MRLAITVLILTFGAVLASAQRTPQLTWEGYITSGADLFIHGKSVDAQGRTTGAVDRPRVRFAAPLPAANRTVEMDVRRGPGRVTVVEQPVPENDFTLIVRIEPREAAAEFYSLAFFWDVPERSVSSSRQRKQRP